MNFVICVPYLSSDVVRMRRGVTLCLASSPPFVIGREFFVQKKGLFPFAFDLLVR